MTHYTEKEIVSMLVTVAAGMLAEQEWTRHGFKTLVSNAAEIVGRLMEEAENLWEANEACLHEVMHPQLPESPPPAPSSGS